MEFLLGASSSALAYTCVYPIDVLKVQYQCQSNSSIISTFKNVIHKQGIRGFYKGYTSNLLTYPIFWGVYFQSGELPFNKIANILIGSSLGSLMSNPLFVLKTRFQTEILTNKSLAYNKLIPQIYRNEGILAFFKGYPITVINNSKLFIQMPLADYLDNHVGMGVASSAAIAKITTSLFTYPCDLIRNIQRNTETKLSIGKLAIQVYKTSGILGYYRGLTLYTAITLPNFVLMMTIKSWLGPWFKK